jgi:hypothetical protein
MAMTDLPAELEYLHRVPLVRGAPRPDAQERSAATCSQIIGDAVVHSSVARS